MLKILLKKDLLRLLCSFSGRKPGKPHKTSLAGFVALRTLAVLLIAFMFSMFCTSLGVGLLPLGMDGLYFTFAAVMGFLLSVIANSFASYSTLFKAKDNELLLSMPIAPGYILLSRIIVLLLTAVIYNATALIPALIVKKSISGSLPAASLVNVLLLIFANAALCCAVAALLGRLLAFLSGRIRNKSLVSTAFIVIFLALYYYFSLNARKYLEMLVAGSSDIELAIKTSFIGMPLYRLGLAATGDIFSLIIYLAVCLLIFTAVCALLSRGLLTASFEQRGVRRYKAEKQAAVELRSPREALFRRELSHFLSSTSYMLNCSFGTVVMVVAAAALVIKQAELRAMLYTLLATVPSAAELMPLAIALFMWLAVGTNDITAPSISLEGKQLWILQSLPLPAGDIFHAKQKLHLALTAPPAMLLLAAAAFVFRPAVTELILIAASTLLFIKLDAACGLVLGLRFPRLDWVNEISPTKRGIAPAIAVCGSFGLIMLMGALYYFLLFGRIGVSSFMAAAVVLMALLTRPVDRWLGKRGAELFRAL